MTLMGGRQAGPAHAKRETRRPRESRRASRSAAPDRHFHRYAASYDAHRAPTTKQHGGTGKPVPPPVFLRAEPRARGIRPGRTAERP